MARSKIQILDDGGAGSLWVRCRVCSHEFHHNPIDGAAKCKWCEEGVFSQWGVVPPEKEEE